MANLPSAAIKFSPMVVLELTPNPIRTSTCHKEPDSNKVDNSRCDKPCMGYPFEMCGGSSSHALANVLLIGSSVGLPNMNNGSGSNTAVSDESAPLKNGNNSSQTGVINGGKALNANNPGMFSPPAPTTTNHDSKEKEENVQSGNSSHPIEDNSEKDSGGTSAGAIAASIMAVFGFGVLFAVAFVFSKRRRQRRAQAVWTENMLLPSSLVHCSNDDERDSHDYSPIYRSNSMGQHSSIPSSTTNVHYPLPPVLHHPRQGGASQLQHPSYPPPLMGQHYSSMRGGQFQPYPLPSMVTQQQYEQNLYESLHHKEPVSSSPPMFSRGPQALQQQSISVDDEQERLERAYSHHSERSGRAMRRDSNCLQRESIDSCASGMRVMNPDGGHFEPDS
ncbi:hypothetical protein BGX28_004674 [Mortierella sp. GBA30]|nr:hypothetical protein BGX28_004674 [Mortierella sp. GBA30]